MFAVIPLSDPLEDLERFQKMLHNWIDAGEIPLFSSLDDQKKIDQLLKSTRSEARKAKKQKTHQRDRKKNQVQNKSKEDNQLEVLLRDRHQERKQQFVDMISKYSKGNVKQTPPTEEEFERIRSKLEANRPSARSAKRSKKMPQ